MNPGFIFKRRCVVIASLSGKTDHAGQEVWVRECSLHPEAYVDEHTSRCEGCEQEGRYRGYRPIAVAQGA